VGGLGENLQVGTVGEISREISGCSTAQGDILGESLQAVREISDPHGINLNELREMRRELCNLQREWADTKAVLYSNFTPIISNTTRGKLNNEVDLNNQGGCTSGTVSEANMSILSPSLQNGRSRSPIRSQLQSRRIFQTEHHSSGESRDSRYENLSDSIGHMRGVHAAHSQAIVDGQFQTGTNSFVDQDTGGVSDMCETRPGGSGQQFASEAATVNSVRQPRTSNISLLPSYWARQFRKFRVRS
jgi:hypothetical protein